MDTNMELMMPIKAAPYEHQKKAFAFAMSIFGVFGEGGGDDAGDDNSLRSVRKRIPKADGPNKRA